VTGNEPPEIVKPVPLAAAALTVTAAVPVEDRVTDCVAAVFKFTFPNAMLVAFTLSVAAAVPNCSANVLATLLALALSITVWAVLTGDTVTVKLAVVDPVATVTEAGTVTAELLLAGLTVIPPLGAAAFRVTEQLSVPAPVIDPLAHVSALNTGTLVPSCSATVLATLLALAVSVTVWAVLTEDAVAVKLAVVDPAATVTEAGTVTAELPLARLSANPPVAAAALNVAVQLSVPAPVIDPLTHVSALNTGALALNCSAKVLATLLALAVSVTAWVVLTEVTVAVKLAVVDPAATVTEAGTLTAELLLAMLSANPPLGAAAFNVAVQLSVPAPVIDPLTHVSALSTGALAPNCSAKVFATLFALAVSVTVWAVLTEDTVAVKLAAVAPAGTVTLAGAVTAVALLVRLTARPPVAAAALSVTVQLSVPAAVIDALAQLNPLTVGDEGPAPYV
jgi:hypothetical protein